MPFAAVMWASLLKCSAGDEISYQVERLCPNFMAADDTRVSDFDIDLSALNPDSKVRVCENRSLATSGILLVENFLTAKELMTLTNNGKGLFPERNDGGSAPNPGKSGYNNHFIDMGADGEFPVASRKDRRAMKAVNKRMNVFIRSEWRRPYFQFVLQNDDRKTVKVRVTLGNGVCASKSI